MGSSTRSPSRSEPLAGATALVLLAGLLASCTSLRDPAGAESGLPPFYRRVENAGRVEEQVLYPLFRQIRDAEGRQTYVFPLFWDREFTSADGEWHDRDWALLPFFFGGSETYEGDYFLFFPFYGNLKGILHKDEMNFALFPLYLDTTERGYDSTHLLWPLISWGEGDGKEDFRFLPFYAEREREGRSWGRSVLWPFFSWGEEDLDTEHPVDSFFAFPFYGYRESDISSTTTWLFPFFSHSENADGWYETNLFTPVYRREEGPKDSAFRIWPFYGESRDGDDLRRWWLWPLFFQNHVTVPEGTLDSFQFLPLYRQTRTTAPDGRTLREVVRLWPLARRTERADGTAWFGLFDLYPFADDGDFDANWAWLWTLFEARTGPEGWGVNLLSGLFCYEEEAEDAALTLLWLLRIPL